MEFCGRQGISLRGHRDDSTSENVNHGNLKSLIDLGVVSEDFILDQNLKTVAKQRAVHLKNCTERSAHVHEREHAGGDHKGHRETVFSEWRCILRYPG